MFSEIKEEHRLSIIDLLDEILEIYEDDNWITIKKYILRYSHPDIRKYFTTRHPKSKKHSLNDFETSLIRYCADNYKINLRLYEEDTHYEEE